ncbi:MAG: DUF4162 domain-containing protein, partial [Staphylococcus equorum]|nr:DUF4162 domain-containing protein [Staphylococcus equorum]
IMLNNGKTVLQGEVHEIREKFGRTKVFLESDLSKDEVAQIAGVETIIEQDHRYLEITLEDPKAGESIFKQATAQGYIPMFNQQPPTLEEIFKMKAGESHE